LAGPIASISSIFGRFTSGRHRALIVSGAAHALHDGYADIIYVLLPVWQAEFGLGYGALALLRGLYTGAMAGLQVSAGSLAERFGSRIVLVLGTAVAALGYLLAGVTGGVPGLCASLSISGAGSSTQHPIGSAAVSRASGAKARGALGIYNFSGDLGKATFPAAFSLLLTVMHWRGALLLLAALGFAVAIAIGLFMPAVDRIPNEENEAKEGVRRTGRGGFPLLFTIGVLDSASRMGLLIFLPFLLKAKGATLPTIGMALALVFMGGAAGKLACCWIGARVGTLWTVIVTEGGTAAAILLVLVLPLAPTLIVLPLLGLMLNGTSSVLYGTVPELTAANQTERAFALFYTGILGSGAIAPVLFGMLGDTFGTQWATIATAVTALATLPLMLALSPRLASE
jgi:MFS family permease